MADTDTQKKAAQKPGSRFHALHGASSGSGSISAPNQRAKIEEEDSVLSQTSMRIQLFFGVLILICMAPFVGPVVGCAVLWHHIDYFCMPFAQWFNRVTAPFNERWTKHPEDGFMMNVVLFIGVLIPALFAYNLWYTLTYGFNIWMAFAYNVFRIGPYFMNFAYVYTLCHKEGHSHLGLWKDPYNVVLRNVFNWWIGLFFGVMPSTFAYGHTRNHHRFNNTPNDIINISDRPRDSILSWISYLPRFFLYAVNVSTFAQFYSERNFKYFWRMLWGTLVFCAFLGMAWSVSPSFAAAYVLYPLFENVILLAGVNWAWHSFISPEDPDNEFINSLTILNGQINVLQEDYHVVHHMYPSLHWTDVRDKYLKDKPDYDAREATVFEGVHTFEIFALVILREYRKLAEAYVDRSGKYNTIEEKEAMLKARLRHCTHGPFGTGPAPKVHRQ